MLAIKPFLNVSSTVVRHQANGLDGQRRSSSGLNVATYAHPIRTCETGWRTARNISNVGLGTDNPFHAEGHKRITASLQVDSALNSRRHAAAILE
jgi:hypothetical protein